ncbi:MAG: MFS transporter, partial [Rhodospirillaceae bacterium]|nr:MFS transporter [Rhodospirillaceae bacterium]
MTSAVANLSHRQRVKAIVAGSTGNLIEWYDFYTYAFMALYFAPLFFPQGDRTAQLLNVAGIYAVGFLIRPVGGWFFGRYADRHGRKSAMVVSVLLMGAGSLLIAVAPTYAVGGVLAPFLLLLARLMQGFSTGGQYGAAATYLSEVAADQKRGFYASFQFVTLIGGQLAALLVLGALQFMLSEEDIRQWGWRVPFALGALVAVGFLLFRDMMHETVTPQTRSEDAGSLRLLIKHPGALFIVVSLSAAGAIGLYTFTTYMQKFLVNTAGMDVKTVSGVMTAAMVIFMLLQPIFGSFSDRIGRRKCLIIFTGLMTVSAVPLLQALSTVRDPFAAFALVLTSLVIMT